MLYDDATGKRVRAPVGRLTIGVGINLDVGLDEYEVDMLERHRLHVGMVAFEREAAALALPESRATWRPPGSRTMRRWPCP